MDFVLYAVKCIHLIAVCAGVGGALIGDLFVIRYAIGQKITESTAEIMHMISTVLRYALALLWFTGGLLLAEKMLVDPSVLQAPKILTKLSMVAFLTANGIAIHTFVLPQFREKIGYRLAENTPIFSGLLPFAFFGAVSVVSWTSATAVALMPLSMMNLPPYLVLGAYAAGILFAMTCILIILCRSRNAPSESHTTDGLERTPHGAYLDRRLETFVLR